MKTCHAFLSVLGFLVIAGSRQASGQTFTTLDFPGAQDTYAHGISDGTCHVPPLFTEPGWSLHAPKEIGIDDFQANRSPDKRYRTTPLGGLFTRIKGGFYHDGRFADLTAVVEHYNQVFGLNLAPQEQQDLIEYLKSL